VGEIERPDGASTGLRPGALSALLADLARAPEDSLAGAWSEALSPGTVVGRFELVREIGRGGFGVVYEARDLELRRMVAFKAVRAGGRAALRQERLLREAEAAARLAHPNLVTLFDVGHCDRGPYLVLELLQGTTLADRLEEGPIPPGEAVRIAVHVARGVAHAHGHGVVHRDLKPANVFLCGDGQVKVLDFGLAHAFGQPRTDGGTPAFMAPEQWRGAPEDERTDVFALGLLLYRMLAGEHPFPAGDRGEALQRPGRAPALEVPEVPGLGALVARMLAKDPVDRPRDGGAVLARLEGLRFRDAPPGPPPEPAPGAGGAARPRAVLAATGALLLLAALAAGILWWRGRGGGDARTVVAVADVVNATGDPELDSISGLLITSLEQSRRLAVLTRARMHDLARQAGYREEARIDEVAGRDICRRARARALLVARVLRLGSVYAMELRALDPGSDAYLFTLRDQTPTKEGILALVDRLSELARQELRESPAEVQAARLSLASVVTDSLEAYRRYFAARDHLERFRFHEAAVELRRSLAVDPRFALAHYELARMGLVGEIPDAERAEHEQAALKLAQRLPPRERSQLEAFAAERAGRLREAEAIRRRLAADFPEDPEVQRALGSMLFEQEKVEEAVPFLRRALELSPTSEQSADLLWQALGFLGRTEELLAVARDNWRRAPGPETALLLSEGAYWAGEMAEAARAAREAADGGENQGRPDFVMASLRLGQFEAAERELDAMLAPSARADPRWFRGNRGAVLAYQGKVAAARAALDAIRDESSAYPAYATSVRLAARIAAGPPAEIRLEADRLAGMGDASASVVGESAAAVAWAGEAAAARRLAGRLRPGSPDAALYRAVAAWREGRLAEALPELRRLAATHASSGARLDAYLLGEASLEAGRAEEAAAALRRFQRLWVPLRWMGWSYPRSLLLLARAEAALGHRDQARRAAAELASIWRRADPDYPPLAELRALEARLGG
jgi:tetratricopeptide (TPR) repeat protein